MTDQSAQGEAALPNLAGTGDPNVGAAPLPQTQAAPQQQAAPAQQTQTQQAADTETPLDMSGMSLAELGGVSMDAIDAKHRFQNFPPCKALWRLKEAKLDLVFGEQKGVRFTCVAVEFYGSPDPTVTAEQVVGETYDHQQSLEADTQQGLIDNFGYIKQTMQDMGYVGSGNLGQLCQSITAAGLMFTATINKFTSKKTGRDMVGMENIAPFMNQPVTNASQ